MMYEKLRQMVLEILETNGLPPVEPVLREIPFTGKLGLAVSNVFQIAKEAKPDADKSEFKKEVDRIAGLIRDGLDSSGEFEKVVIEKGYVNCFFEPGGFARDLSGRIFKDGTDWARGKPGGDRIMIEYSQPNTHKAFHIGHVRNVALGATLVRACRYLGRDTVAANYIGDIGAHVFKSLWYLEKHAVGIENAPSDPAERGIWLGEVYAKADSLLAESAGLKNEVWDILKPLSVELSDLWLDDSLVGKIVVDPLVRKVALKEADLFENRASSEVGEIIGRLADASLALYEEGMKSGKAKTPHAADDLVRKLKQIRAGAGFGEIWNRENEVLEIADRWYKHDADLVSLWKETRRWSLEDFKRIYGELDAPFDIDFTESEVEHEGILMVEDLVRDGIAAVSEGAKIVEIDKQLHEKFGEPLKDKYRVAVLTRSDGTPLYSAKELALARRKFNDYGIEESIYVVAIDQKFYFEQIFQVLRLMGFKQWAKCFHLPYELVMLPGGKMSSRKGHVVLYDEVMTELKARAFRTVNDKNPGLADDLKAKVAQDVARGALIYGMLRVDTNKTIHFDFDEVLDFDGRSAPYIQYAAARASSILRKGAAEGIEIPNEVAATDFSAEMTSAEIDLLGMLSRFPRILEKVLEDKKPIHLASYVYDLAVSFSEFYHQCPVLSAEPGVRRSRLLMVVNVRTTLEAGLGILGIPVPKVM
jgi:arginyl-tRNA synthetase